MAEKSNNNIEYAGFGIRLVAYLIDNILFGIITSIVIFPIFLIMGIGIAGAGENEAAAGGIGLLSVLIVFVVALVLTWVYYAYTEASAWQGTPGKKILGIKVTDTDGKRLTLGKSTIRFLVKFVSAGAVTSLIYLVAAFTEKKQALHDMAASSLVVKK